MAIWIGKLMINHRNCASRFSDKPWFLPNIGSEALEWSHEISWDLGPQRLCVWDYVDPSKNKRYIAIHPKRYSIIHHIGNQYQMTSGDKVCIIFRKANLWYGCCTMTKEGNNWLSRIHPSSSIAISKNTLRVSNQMSPLQRFTPV